MTSSVTTIQAPSVKSLLLYPRFGEVEIATATGFIVERSGQHYLITNWHVVSGRHPDTYEVKHSQGALPNNIAITHNASPGLGWVVIKAEDLYDGDGNARWLEHPSFGRGVDVVALPLRDIENVAVYSYDPWDTDRRLAAGVSERVNIVGFPYGRTGGHSLGVWSTGHVASEPDVDYDGKPCFLIDSRTRQGQSGSPVLAFSSGGSRTLESGDVVMGGGPIETLLGVYSGRISEESDLGIVWKRRVVREVIDGGVRGREQAP